MNLMMYTLVMLLASYHPTFFSDLTISKPFAAVFTFFLEISCTFVMTSLTLRWVGSFTIFCEGTNH